MVERQDIDALLISALYGELTPAEETRLATHLESHPADRTALDDLTRAREALHQSRILAFQYEPPQSISALLMQEASRRAPKKPVEGEGWFARFVRSFVQHPAMAAAAMIVVVVGAASLVSRNSDKMMAETPAVETTKTAPAAAPTPTPDTTVAAPTTPPATGMNGADQFKVALADGEKELEGKADLGVEKGNAKLDNVKALPETDPNTAFYDSSDVTDRKKVTVTTKPTGANVTANDGLELRRREAMPKDFDEASAAKPAKPAEEKLSADKNLAKQDAAKQEAVKGVKGAVERQYAAEAPVADDVRGNRDQTGYADGRTGTTAGQANNGRTVGGAGGGGSVAPGAAPTAPQPAPAPTTTVQQGPRNVQAPRANPPPPPPTKTAPAQIATDSATRGEATKSKEKADKVSNDPNLAWAKDQHAALVTAVRANNCGRAANIALSIANRAPSYYAQNVETDRSVKECIAYINNEREKDAELRAQRAKKSQLKNAEPAAPKRAADQPSRATVDSAK